MLKSKASPAILPDQVHNNYFHEHPCRNSDHCSWGQHWPAEIVLTRMPCFLPASNASTCSETTNNIFLQTFRHVIRIIRLLEKFNATFCYKVLKCRKSAGSGKEVLCLASLYISWQLLKWSKTNFSWSLVWNKQFGLCGTHPSNCICAIVLHWSHLPECHSPVLPLQNSFLHHNCSYNLLSV